MSDDTEIDQVKVGVCSPDPLHWHFLFLSAVNQSIFEEMKASKRTAVGSGTRTAFCDLISLCSMLVTHDFAGVSDGFAGVSDATRVYCPPGYQLTR